MALADKLGKLDSDGSASKIGKLLHYLPDADSDALEESLHDPGVQHMAITRALLEEYEETGDARYKVSVASVKRYRDALGVKVSGSTR